MKKKQQKIIIIGAGGHARSLVSVIEKNKHFKIVGYISLGNEGDLLGIKHLGSDKDLPRLLKKEKGLNAVIGIGSIGLSDRREKVFNNLKKIGYKLPVIISPDAIVNKHATIEEGSVVLDGAVVNVNARIGKGCIINTKACIEHDCCIGNFVHICSGAVLSGGVEVGDSSFIGAGATVIQYKVIPDKCLIGAGAVVIQDCVKSGYYVGVPAVLK